MLEDANLTCIKVEEWIALYLAADNAVSHAKKRRYFLEESIIIHFSQEPFLLIFCAMAVDLSKQYINDLPFNGDLHQWKGRLNDAISTTADFKMIGLIYLQR